MSDGELRQQLHAALDELLDETAKVDPRGGAVERWCRILLRVFGAVARAARQREFGTATLVVQIVGGTPDPHKGAEAAGFIASVK